MKDLTTYIKENLEAEVIEESSSDYKFIKFTFGEDSDADNFKSACNKADLYYEETDSKTIRVKVRKDKDTTPVFEFVNDYINNIPEDKQSELESVISGLQKSLNKMDKFVNDESEEDDKKEDDKKEDDKKEEE